MALFLVLVMGFVCVFSCHKSNTSPGMQSDWGNWRNHPKPHTHLQAEVVHIGQCLQLLVPLLHSQHKVVHVRPEGANQGSKNLQGWIKVVGCCDFPCLGHQGGGVLLFLLKEAITHPHGSSNFLPRPRRPYLLFTASGKVISIFFQLSREIKEMVLGNYQRPCNIFFF